MLMSTRVQEPVCAHTEARACVFLGSPPQLLVWTGSVMKPEAVVPEQVGQGAPRCACLCLSVLGLRYEQPFLLFAWVLGFQAPVLKHS